MRLPLHLAMRGACALGCALALWSGGALRAASFAENRDYAAAVKAFNDGLWDYAETRFAQFVTDYPKSERAPEAVLYQARAQLEQHRHAQALALLTARLNEAGPVADRYLYWIGAAHLANTNYAAAAEAFARVVREFPASARRLAAAVQEAAARGKLAQWPRVIELLQNPEGPFQLALKTNTNTETLAQGRLLLAEAGLAQKDFPTAEAALEPLATQKLRPELDWQRRYLLCRVELGTGRTNEALRASDELVKVAGQTGRQDLLAESIALNADILERLGQPDQAVAAFERNLTPQRPEAYQRQALLKIAALALARHRPGEAIERIEQFLQQSTNAPATDATALALLTLGELHLKQHLALTQTNAVPAETPHLQLALENFDRLVNTFSHSPLVGKAQLDLGWCYELLTHLPASSNAFQAAAARLPPSEDLAVARFKLADVQYAMKDYAGALRNYQAALDAAATLPQVKEELSAQASYQMLRASLNATNLAVASEVMEKILQTWPNRPVAESGVLLIGQTFSDLNEPDRARALFARFVELFPASPLRPQVELAIARTWEQQANWPAAITNYDAWLERHPTNDLRPQAEFQRAWVHYEAGQETNALRLFTNFVAQFPAHPLAPQAQWWVADYFYNHQDFPNAEKNYKLVFQNWPALKLAYQARFMAGRAAVDWQQYSAATNYFTMLTGDTNCPPDLWRDAMFAYGGALMLRNAGETNNPTADLSLALKVFGKIQEKFPDTEIAAAAAGEMGNCYLQLAARDPAYYTNAMQAYQQALNAPPAGIATRSLAQIGLGATLEAQARLAAEADRKALLKQALANYLDVLYQRNLREHETPDVFCLKRAGLEAARLVETAGDRTQAVNLYHTLGALLPPLKASLERRIQRAQAVAPDPKD
jgi:TolA-binding protein